MATTTMPGQGRLRLWRLIVPALVLGMLAVVLTRLTTAGTTSPPQVRVACVNDDAGTCVFLNDILTHYSAGAMLVSATFPSCDDSVATAVQAFDVVFVDGVMRGSQYQGPDCTAAIVAARGAKVRPVVIGYSTDYDLGRTMVQRGANDAILPTAGGKNIFQLVETLLSS